MGSVNEDSPLVQEPYSKYWDGFLTRREAQRAINKLAANDADLNAFCDTLAIIGNFLCENLGVTRGQLDAYVASKKAEIEALKVAKAAAQSERDLGA